MSQLPLPPAQGQPSRAQCPRCNTTRAFNLQGRCKSCGTQIAQSQQVLATLTPSPMPAANPVPPSQPPSAIPTPVVPTNLGEEYEFQLQGVWKKLTVKMVLQFVNIGIITTNTVVKISGVELEAGQVIGLKEVFFLSDEERERLFKGISVTPAPATPPPPAAQPDPAVAQLQRELQQLRTAQQQQALLGRQPIPPPTSFKCPFCGGEIQHRQQHCGWCGRKLFWK